MVSWKHELLPPFHREQKGTAGGNSPELNLLFIFSVPLFFKKNQLYLICNIASVSGVRHSDSVFSYIILHLQNQTF